MRVASHVCAVFDWTCGGANANHYEGKQLTSVAFKFEPGEDLQAAAKRVALEQLRMAIDHLNCTDDKRDRHIHEARKSMKRLRGLVRLVRADLGGNNYMRENATFRDAAGLISGLRDAAVRVQTLDKLIEYCGADIPRSGFSAVRLWLAQRHKNAYSRIATDSRAVQTIVRELERARQRVGAWSFPELDWVGVSAGLQRTYAKGRREYRLVYRNPSDDGLHSWRKSVKYLWHHAQLLGERDPAALGVMAEELDHLGELLGDDHDLVLLDETLTEAYPRGQGPSTIKALRRRISRRRRQLQQAARAVGSRVYVENPRTFRSRLPGSWPSRRDHVAQPRVGKP